MFKRPAAVNLVAAACLGAPEDHYANPILDNAQSGPVCLVRLRKVPWNHIHRMSVVVRRFWQLAMPLLQENTHVSRDVSVFSRRNQLLRIMRLTWSRRRDKKSGEHKSYQYLHMDSFLNEQDTRQILTTD